MDDFRHLMLTPDSPRRADIVTDLCLALVADRGFAALTVRAAALLCGCSRQAVQQWFGGQHELRRVVATCFTARWRRWLSARLRAHGPAGLLAESEEVRVWCRFRLALLEHAHREDWVADLAALVVEEERAGLAGLLGSNPEADDVLALHALLTGLALTGVPPARADEVIDSVLLARKQGTRTFRTSRHLQTSVTSVT